MRAALCFALAVFGLGFVPSHAAQTQAALTVGQRREAVLFWSQARREARFRQMYRHFPSLRVAHGAHVQALPQGQPLTLPGRDLSSWLAAYMHKYHVAGVMVLQNGRVRLVRYGLGFGPTERWTSFSVAKSVTSVLLGIALEQGYVHSLDDQLDTYIPELKHTAYADVTVRDLLTMTSGVRWDENYSDPHSDVAQMYMGACVGHEAQALSYLAKLPRGWPPGTHWNYNTAETDLLGVLVQRATHRSLAAYLSQTIWKPYGMAESAYWVKDGCSGLNTGGSGFSATLADYARFGEFMLNGGRIDRRTVIGPVLARGCRAA
ncbi:MAG: serine hydrolase domain-containing protein [Gammaproteobacteria bacterium]